MTGQASPRRFYGVLAIITGLALVWRVAYVLWQGDSGDVVGDPAFYHWQANDIANGDWFVDPTQLRVFGRLTPSAFHPPAFSLYLAVVSRVIGTSFTTHQLASVVIGATAVFLLGVLARRIFASNWAGWIAAALAAAYAHLWINDQVLGAESMYVLVIAAVMLLAYRFWDTPSLGNAALLGTSIAIAALTRAEALALYVFLAIPLALMRRELTGRARIRLALTACAVGAAVLAPWVLYNATRFERTVFVSNGIGSVLMVGNCEYVDRASGESISTYRGRYVAYWSIDCTRGLVDKIAAAHSRTRAEALERDLGLIPGTDFAFFGDESTHEVAWRAVGLDDIADHRADMPRVVALRVLRMWDLFRPAQNIDPFNAYLEDRGLWQSRLATAQYYPLLALSIAGLVILRRRRVPILPFLAIAATVTVTAATTFGITRYRAPVDAMLPVLAAGTIVWIARWARTRARGRPAPAAAESL